MSEEIKFGHNIFGYTTLIRDGQSFVALTGEGVDDLRSGMTVTLLGDSRGYVPSGFHPGDEVIIVGFAEPFKDGKSDHIVKVDNEKCSGWIKPSNIQRNVSVRSGLTEQDKRHRELKKKVHPAMADLLDEAYLSLSVEEQQSLSNDIGSYVDRLVAYCLQTLDKLGEPLSSAIARVYEESPTGERFIRDPIGSTSISEAVLYLDPDGELISIQNPDIVWDTSSPSRLVMKKFQSYKILTGRMSGQRVSWNGESIEAPKYSPRVVSQVRSTKATKKKVFLCHSTGDKEKARDLHTKLQGDGLQPWLDEIDLAPGVEWRHEINKAVRQADVVLVCLSRSSVSKTGFVQKEIKIALDAADERPEGAIYIVPARLEKCPVPERLNRWQWVDLFESDGYDRLLKALKR